MNLRHLLLAVSLTLATGASAAIPAEVSAALDRLPAYSVGDSLVPVKTIETYVQNLTAKDADRAIIADRLVKMLAAPNTKAECHAFLGRQLALVADDAQIPELARLLDRPETVEAARYALTMMEQPAAGAALREALGRLKGPALAGVVQSLGERRDAEAVPALAALAVSGDEGAVSALGRIGGAGAADALLRLPVERSAAARIECAMRLEEGKSDLARRLVAPLLDTKSAPDHRVAALSVVAQHPGPDGVGILLAACEDESDFVALKALRLAVQTDAAQVVAKLGPKLGALNEARQAALFDELVRHPEPSARSTALAAVSGPTLEPAAATLLGLIGRAEDVDALAALAVGKGAVAACAQAALAQLAADGTEARILKAIDAGPASSVPALLEALADRQSSALEAATLKAVGSSDESIQVAAIRALGRGGSTTAAEALLKNLSGAMAAKPRAEAERAFALIAKRAENRDALAKQGIAALSGTADVEVAGSLMRTLAACGGAEALTAVRAGLAKESLRQPALRVLVDWPEDTAVSALLEIAAKPGSDTERTLALRGAVRLALAAQDPGVGLAQIVPLVASKSDRLELLAALAEKPSVQSLKFAVDLALKTPEVQTEAVLASITAGRALARRNAGEVRAQLARLETLSLTAEQQAAIKSLAAGAQTGTGLPRMTGPARDAYLEALRGRLASNETLVAWLDCGVESATAGPGPALTVASGAPYAWDAAVAIGGVSAATVAFDGSAVVVEASALDPKKAYALLVTWWDFDHADRKGSIAVNGRVALPATALPSWSRKQQPAQVRVPVQGDAAGKARIEIRHETGANITVCELALVETGAAVPVVAAPVDPNAKKVLIVTGLDYPGHKWRETAPVLRDAIGADKRLAVTINENIVDALTDPKLAENAVIVLHYMNWENPGPGMPSLENLRKAIAGGTGLVMVHFACGAFQDWPEFVKIAGRVYNPKLRGHDPRGPFRVRVVDAQHPIMAGMADFDTDDELYTCLDGQTPIHTLADANSKVDHKDYPMAFVLEYGKGRVFHCTLGHDVKALSVPAVGELYRRATAWTAGLPPKIQ